VNVDPIAFVRAQPPFDRLGTRDLERLTQALEIVFLPAGARILERGGAPATHLYLIRSGIVRLERDDGLVIPLEEGELFGYRSLLTREAPTMDAVADTDTLCYRFAAEAARPLLEHPAVAATLARGLADRLRAAPAATPRLLTTEVGLTAPLRDLTTRAPLVVDPSATVAEAARVMREAGASSVLVARPSEEGVPGGPELGILTDRDLRNRVVAESRPPDTPVETVASRPALTRPADTPLLEAVVFMLEHDVHHLPLEEGGRIIGVVSDTDLLRRQARSPLYVLRSVERAESSEALAGYGAELGHVVRHLAASGVEATSIGRVVASLNDTLVRTLLRLAEERLGPPPVPYAWLALGSEGRFEQILPTDQDNALVFAGAEPVGGEVAAWFGQLSEAVVGGLLQAGFPPCPGGSMATRWHHSEDWWVDRFEQWIAVPEPQALIDAGIFFDFRRVAGSLDLEPLEQVVDGARAADLFLAQMAASAVSFHPPVGAFRRVLTRDGAVDLKRGAVMGVVALARVHALAAASRARATLDRLKAAVGAGVLSTEDGENLAEAFRFVLSLRLAAQLEEVAMGQPPDNDVDLGRLAPLERHHLKDALIAIRDGLEGLAFSYQTSRLR
jgi:CBS domain-containing protein